MCMHRLEAGSPKDLHVETPCGLYLRAQINWLLQMSEIYTEKQFWAGKCWDTVSYRHAAEGNDRSQETSRHVLKTIKPTVSTLTSDRVGPKLMATLQGRRVYQIWRWQQFQCISTRVNAQKAACGFLGPSPKCAPGLKEQTWSVSWPNVIKGD